MKSPFETTTTDCAKNVYVSKQNFRSVSCDNSQMSYSHPSDSQKPTDYQ